MSKSIATLYLSNAQRIAVEPCRIVRVPDVKCALSRS
jgi:hypothetical protein